MNHFSAFWTRLFALTRKESKQLLRDKSSMAIGFILPIILILLFGYGLSFDLTNGRVGVVEQQPTPQSQQLMSGLNGSKYITVKHYPSFSGYTDLMVDGAPLPHQPDTIIRWLIDRLRS